MLLGRTNERPSVAKTPEASSPRRLERTFLLVTLRESLWFSVLPSASSRSIIPRIAQRDNRISHVSPRQVFCRFKKKSHYRISAPINQIQFRAMKGNTCLLVYLPLVRAIDESHNAIFVVGCVSARSQYCNSRRAFAIQVVVQRRRGGRFVEMFKKRKKKKPRRNLPTSLLIISRGEIARSLECVRCYRNTRIANKRSHAGHQSTRQWYSRETSTA